MSGTKMKRIAFPAAGVIVCAIVTLILAELGFRVIHAYAESLKGTVFERVAFHTEPPFSWEGYFLENNIDRDQGLMPSMTEGGLHRPHATRGWALRPNLSVVKDGAAYTTNGDGFRSDGDFSFDPARFGVVIVGDSFTFGDGVDDSITWPYLLQRMEDGLNVFNLAGSGYGVDQMYITLSETISRLKPRLVIAAFIDNDLKRSMIDFRDYKKPRFVLESGELVLTNTPIGGVAEVLAEIKGSKIDNYSRLQVVNVYNSVRGKLKAAKGEPDDCGPDCVVLNERLFEGMREMAGQHGADFMMVYLPYDEEIVYRNVQSYGERFFNDYRSRHDNFFLNTQGAFLSAPFRKHKGHYKGPENRLVSRLVLKRIRELPAYKDWSGMR